jgi:hypothetical protein
MMKENELPKLTVQWTMEKQKFVRGVGLKRH